MSDKTKQLHDACQAGNYEVVRALVTDGADVNATLDGLTAIQVATNAGKRLVVGLLLSFHETRMREITDLRSSFGDALDSVLVTAAKAEWPDILQRMLDIGAYENKDLRVAALGAIECGNFECILVLDHYVDFETEEEYMRAAIKADKPRIVDFLVKKQIPGFKRARFGWE